MFAFMGRGGHGNEAYCFEPERTRAAEGATRGEAKAFDAGGGRGTVSTECNFSVNCREANEVISVSSGYRLN